MEIHAEKVTRQGPKSLYISRTLNPCTTTVSCFVTLKEEPARESKKSEILPIEPALLSSWLWLVMLAKL